MGTPESQLRVFVSYRRDDSADVSGRIDDRLVAFFGRENVFKDVDSIPVGVDFRSYLDSAISDCDVLLVIVGEQWVSVADDEGNRRLDDETDFVRIEVESALARNIPVVPVLVGGATMPKPAELPESIREFSFRNAAQVRRDPDFHADANRLIKAIENSAAISPPLPSADLISDDASARDEDEDRFDTLIDVEDRLGEDTSDKAHAFDTWIESDNDEKAALLEPDNKEEAALKSWADTKREEADEIQRKDTGKPVRVFRRRTLVGVALLALPATVIGAIIAFLKESDWRDESRVPPLVRLNSVNDPKHSSEELRRQIICVALLVEQGASLEQIADDIVDRFHLLETWMFADLSNSQKDLLPELDRLANLFFGRMPSATSAEILKALPALSGRGFPAYVDVIVEGVRSRVKSGQRLPP